MIKKIFLTLLFIPLTYAETCPTVSEIKTNNLHGWQAYTNDNGTLLTSKQLQKFENDVQYFYYIRWLDRAPEGESHCYYLNKNKKDTIAFLSKAHLKPDFTTGYWFFARGEPRCSASEAACQFVDEKNNQLISTD